MGDNHGRFFFDRLYSGSVVILVRLYSFMKREEITQLMISEWVGIPILKLRKKLYGQAEFTKEERQVITEIFMGKYTEEELFGKDEVNDADCNDQL